MCVLSDPDNYAPDWQPAPLPWEDDPEEARRIETLLEHVDIVLAAEEREDHPWRWGCCGVVVGADHRPGCYMRSAR